MNVNNTVVSKRKIAKLITELIALRRRGFPSEVINNFCARLGVTGAQGTVDPQMLEASVRDVLNLTAPRKLVVLEPLKVTIKNFPESKAIKVKVPDFPNDPEKGSHEIRLIFIEKSFWERSQIT